MKREHRLSLIDSLLLFQDGITKIAALPVRLEERDFTEKITTVEDYQELDICIASSRLDVFLAGVSSCLESGQIQLIEKQAVQVNYHLVEKSDYTVQAGI